MELFGALPAIPFTNIVAGSGGLLMLLAIVLLSRRVELRSSDPKSSTTLCLKCLSEGHEPASAIEFVADWGPSATRREFRKYVKRLKQGRPLEEILDSLRKAHPSADTELLAACLISKAQTGLFSPVVSDIVREAAKQREQTQTDINFVVGGSRRWVVGLVWIGILGGAMLLIALPIYSNTLLKTPIGRDVMVIALALEAVGLIAAGRLLSLPNRLERNLNEP